MRIHTAAAVAAVAAAALATPSHAAPFAGRVGRAAATVRLRGTDGRTYAVTFTVRSLAPAGGTATYTLDLGIASCSGFGCGTTKRYSLPLAAGQVQATDDMTSVNVKVPALGTTLALVWTSASDPSSVELPAVEVDTSVTQVAVQGNDRPAQVRATLWGASCRVEGTFASTTAAAPEGYAFDEGPRPPKTAPPQFAKRAKRVASCAS
jgi:hypothetical protein